MTSALELLPRLPARPERDRLELELQTTLGPVLMITKGWAAPEAEQVYVRAYALSHQGGDSTQRFSALMGLYGLAFQKGDLRAARERQHQLLSYAQQQQEPTLLVEAHHAGWSSALSLGELAAAQAHTEKGLALYDLHLHYSNARIFTGHDPAVCALGWGALVLWLRGYPAQARRSSEQAMAMAHELKHPFTIVFALNNAAQLHQFLRERSKAGEEAQAVLELAAKEGFPYFLSWGRVLQGWAMENNGQVLEGISRIRDGLLALRATGTELWRSYGLSLLAETEGRAGRIDEAMTALREALAVVLVNTEHWWEAELYRLKGELLLGREPRQRGPEGTRGVKGSELSSPRRTLKEWSPPPADGMVDANSTQAQNCFQQAIEIARKQDAKSLELRATMSLARLLRETGRRDSAHAMLAEIYAWFTEGFDTADLKDAKALLDQIKA